MSRPDALVFKVVWVWEWRDDTDDGWFTCPEEFSSPAAAHSGKLPTLHHTHQVRLVRRTLIEEIEPS